MERHQCHPQSLSRGAVSGDKSALTAAAPCRGRGCDTRNIQKRLDKCREHICPIAGTNVRLDEEGFERCTNIGQGFVVPNEEATRIGCIQHVEGTSNMRLIAEGCAM